jgi:hypothetical protein
MHFLRICDIFHEKNKVYDVLATRLSDFPFLALSLSLFSMHIIPYFHALSPYSRPHLPIFHSCTCISLPFSPHTCAWSLLSCTLSLISPITRFPSLSLPTHVPFSSLTCATYLSIPLILPFCSPMCTPLHVLLSLFLLSRVLLISPFHLYSLFFLSCAPLYMSSLRVLVYPLMCLHP